MMAQLRNAGAGSYVLLQIGKRRFALPAEIVSELAPPVRLHTFPHNSPLLAGVIVRRGRVVPVYDVASILLGRSSSVQRFYLIAQRTFDGASEPSAIPVTGECELVTAEMQPAGDEQRHYVTGRLAISGESIDVLDFDALVSANGAQPGEHVRAEARS